MNNLPVYLGIALCSVVITIAVVTLFLLWAVIFPEERKPLTKP